MGPRVESVRSCSACGGDHEGLIFGELATPEVVRGLLCRWAAPCPADGTTLYLSDRDAIKATADAKRARRKARNLARR